MKISFDIKGLARLETKLKELGPRVVTNVSGRALRAKARPIVQRSKEILRGKTKKGTGALARSITTKLHRTTGGSRTIDIGYRRPVSRRAHLTEFGTVHSAAIPHMRPALDEKGKEGIRDMGRVLGEGIEREAKG